MEIRAARIGLTSGDVINVVDGVTVLVGPSNAGKSLVLRESRDHAVRGPSNFPPLRAVSQVELEYPGSPEGYFNRLAKTYNLQAAGQYSYGPIKEEHLYISNVVVTRLMVSEWWGGRGNQHSPHLSGTLCTLLNADGRLSLVQDSQAFDPLDLTNNRSQNRNQSPQPPQKLWENPALEKQVSDLLQRAFGVSLTVSRGGVPDIRLHVGSTSRQPISVPDLEYLREIRQMPLWREQGDGMKSFLGIILALTTVNAPIVFIDEPEAFLHPPQARLLGKLLVTLSGSDTQVLVATHSSHVLDGIIAASGSADSQVSIARLTRQGDANRAAQVDTENIRKLYDDPLTRYYNVLDGLFANATVLCEADGDCTYYRAVMDTIDTLEDGTIVDSMDLHFTHCAGKSRLSAAVKTLRSVGAAVVSVVDIDFLRDDNDFAKLVEAAGGDPKSFDRQRRVIKAAIEGSGVRAERPAVRAQILAVLDGGDEKNLSNSELERIKEAITAKGGWYEAKRYGRESLSGDALNAFDQLHSSLQKMGILVVPVGELEGFHRGHSNQNKSVWLSKVLAEKRYGENKEATDFVTKILETAVQQQARVVEP